MKYVRSPLFSFQILVQVLLIALFLFLTPGEGAQAVAAGIMLCTVGIPHGANDYLYRKNTTSSGLAVFTAAYLGVMGLYLGLWLLSPAAALVVFFAVSFHHFGQSNFENNTVRHIPSLLWGLWITVFPVLLHFQEATSIFADMLRLDDDSGIALPTAVKWAAAAIIGGIYIAALFRYERSERARYLLQFALVTLWYLATPLLFGFITVFCLWHALQSLQHQLQSFKASSGGTSSDFFKALLPFGTAAVLGFAAFLYFRGIVIGEAFILLSLITLPHVVVMHRLYRAADRKAAMD